MATRQSGIFSQHAQARSSFEMFGFEIIEVRDSQTGYFIPARYGMGVWSDGKIVDASPSSSSASSGNSGRHSGQETMFGGFPKVLDSW